MHIPQMHKFELQKSVYEVLNQRIQLKNPANSYNGVNYFL